MTTNQEGKHEAVRAITGTARSYNEDWHALFDDDGIAAGPFDSRMLAWINATLSTSYTNVNEAMQAFAVEQGFANWASMNTFESGFSLSSLPNVAALYEPYDTSKVFAERTSPTTPSTVGGVVGTLYDTSVNASHVAAGSDAARPLLRAGVAGNYVEFDGVNKSLRKVFTLVQPFTRITLLRANTWTLNERFMDGATTDSQYVYQRTVTPECATRNGSGLYSVTTIPLTTWFVLTEVVNGASSKAKINNGSFTTLTYGGTNPGGVSFGANGTGGAQFGHVDIGGCVITSAVLSDDDIAAAVTFLGAKQGLTI